MIRPRYHSTPRIGRTDDFCHNIAENPVHLRDLHATMLHILGIDNTHFTYPFREPASFILLVAALMLAATGGHRPFGGWSALPPAPPLAGPSANK